MLTRCDSLHLDYHTDEYSIHKVDGESIYIHDGLAEILEEILTSEAAKERVCV